MYDVGRLSALVPELLREIPAPFPQHTRPPEPYSLAHFTAWLEAHDPNETYACESHTACLLGRYQTEMGRPALEGDTPFTAALSNFGARRTPNGTVWLMNTECTTVYYAALYSPHTFGAALARLQARV